jgi:hypothetical protein
MSDTTRQVGEGSRDPNYLSAIPSPEQYRNSDVTPRRSLIRFLAPAVLWDGDNVRPQTHAIKPTF